MLGTYFYHEIIRRTVIAFGTLFNDINIRHKNSSDQSISQIKVPLAYGPMQKFLARIEQQPELNKPIAMTLPRLAFEMTSIQYDPTRKANVTQTFKSLDGVNLKKVFLPVPYNIGFQLNLISKIQDDALQVVEQILPYFTPDYTLTADIAGINEPIDLPIILQNVSYDPDYVGGPENLRVLTWTLNFTMKGYMYGPISNTNIIRTVTANTFNDTFNLSNTRKLTVNSAAGSGGTGTFKVGELLYQGDSFDTATATTYVESWSPSTNALVVVDTTGVLKEGKFIFGAVSNAAYNIISFSTNDFQLS